MYDLNLRVSESEVDVIEVGKVESVMCVLDCLLPTCQIRRMRNSSLAEWAPGAFWYTQKGSHGEMKMFTESLL